MNKNKHVLWSKRQLAIRLHREIQKAMRELVLTELDVAETADRVAERWWQIGYIEARKREFLATKVIERGVWV